MSRTQLGLVWVEGAEECGTAAGAAWPGEQGEADEQLMEQETENQPVLALQGTRTV